MIAIASLSVEGGRWRVLAPGHYATFPTREEAVASLEAEGWTLESIGAPGYSAWSREESTEALERLDIAQQQFRVALGVAARAADRRDAVDMVHFLPELLAAQRALDAARDALYTRAPDRAA